MDATCAEDDTEIYDVIIIGAGPCGLAVAARLRERTPAALFTEEEHRRLQFIGRHGGKMTLKNSRSGRVSMAKGKKQIHEYRLAVIDAEHDEWMGRWNKLFAAYEIPHLRSHMLFHVDPHDRDSLLAQAVCQGRQAELVEMKGCVGKELSKHAKKKKARFYGSRQDAHVNINERDRNDYFQPSQSLFCDHCNDVVDRYDLRNGMIFKEQLTDISYGVVNGVSIGDESVFTVTTGRGRRYARAVVVAVGPGNNPQIPSIPGMSAVQGSIEASREQQCVFPQACHSMDISTFPDPIVQGRMGVGGQTNVLVIGGGLTSAQLSDLAIRRGVTRVWHVMRGPLRVKHFDVDLEWIGKFRNTQQARFWQADSDEERLTMLKDARGGGSVTPLYQKRLRSHVAAGRLILCEKTVLAEARFVKDTTVSQPVDKGGAWVVRTDPPVKDLPRMDYIYFATGIQSDFRTLPYLRTMMCRYPIRGIGGFPCLNDDLMWKDGVPLFFTGRLAALKLGPAGPNLGGARQGAERIAWALEDILAAAKRNEGEGFQPHGEDEEDHLFSYFAGRGSKYRSLLQEA